MAFVRGIAQPTIEPIRYTAPETVITTSATPTNPSDSHIRLPVRGGVGRVPRDEPTGLGHPDPDPDPDAGPEPMLGGPASRNMVRISLTDRSMRSVPSLDSELP